MDSTSDYLEFMRESILKDPVAGWESAHNSLIWPLVNWVYKYMEENPIK